MRRPIIALAAAACLAATACSPGQPAESSTPTEMVTPAAETSSPSSSATASTSTSPSVSQSATASASPATSPSASPAQSPTTSTSSTQQATGENVDLASATFTIAAQDAIDLAVERAGGGFAYSIELDWSGYDSAWVYELDVLMDTMDIDIDINADTGELLELERDDTDDAEEAIDLESPMTWETARDIALGASQGRITSWKLSYDDDYTAYEFDIEDSSGDDIEVEVRVDTGAVRIDD